LDLGLLDQVVVDQLVIHTLEQSVLVLLEFVLLLVQLLLAALQQREAVVKGGRRGASTLFANAMRVDVSEPILLGDD